MYSTLSPESFFTKRLIFIIQQFSYYRVNRCGLDYQRSKTDIQIFNASESILNNIHQSIKYMLNVRDTQTDKIFLVRESVTMKKHNSNI